MEKVTIEVPRGMELKQKGNVYTLVEKEYRFEKGKDYICLESDDIIIDYDPTLTSQLGFVNGFFKNNVICFSPKNWQKATENEVIQVFTLELIRRYGENWENIKIRIQADGAPSVNNKLFTAGIIKTLKSWTIWGKNGCLYFKGKWAEKLEEKSNWENFGFVRGYYISSSSGMVKYNLYPGDKYNKNVWPTKEEAEAALALSQLCQWRDKYNEGWKPDWANNRERKHCIIIHKDLPQKDSRFHIRTVLAFKTIDIRNRFLEDFEDLIKVAIPLL